MQRAIQNHIAAHQIELSKQYAENDEAAMQAAQEYGVEFITLPPEDVARMKEAAESFWNEIEGLSPHSERMIQSYRAYKEYRGIE
jgi:TRAP-type C4-dicarboxylate transport system substrate-binding protein